MLNKIAESPLTLIAGIVLVGFGVVGIYHYNIAPRMYGGKS